MTRAAHHRADYRTGPHHSWVRRKAYHLAKVLAPTWALGDILRELDRVGFPAGFNRVISLRARHVYEEALIYATDETGEVWK